MKTNALYYYSLLTVLACAFFLSAYALEVNGIQYVSEGGSALFKIHLYSYIGLLVFIVFLLNNGLKGLAKILSVFFKPWLALVFSISYLIIYGLFKHGTSGMAYVVDTLLIPVLLFPIFMGLNDVYKRKFLYFLVALVFINSGAAAYEYIKGQQIFQYVYEEHWVYFRSTAFFSHPLNNALILSSVSCFLFRYKIVQPVFLFIVVVLALFCFGARTATAIFLLFASFEIFSIYRQEQKQRGGLVFKEVIILKTVFFTGLFFTLYAVLELGFGQRIFENVSFDGSARSRYDVFYVFELLSLDEYLFGARPEFFSNLIFYIDNAVVENFVIAWFLFYGLVGSTFIIYAFYWFIFSLFFNGCRSSRFAIVVFVIISISNNSLASKTPVLLFVLATYALTFNNLKAIKT